jgi:STE24 endopeptidase
MLVVYPYAIMPLFNKFTPLPTDSPFYAPIKDLADKLNFPLSKIWVIDGSIRSSHSNAFFMVRRPGVFQCRV